MIILYSIDHGDAVFRDVEYGTRVVYWELVVPISASLEIGNIADLLGREVVFALKGRFLVKVKARCR